MSLIAYKCFNKDITCKVWFQYEEGKTYETSEEISLCENGFHACLFPLDCFRYYSPISSVYHEVIIEGNIQEAAYESKIVTNKITIGRRLTLRELIQRSIEYLVINRENAKTESVFKVKTKGSVNNTITEIEAPLGISRAWRKNSIAASSNYRSVSIADDSCSISACTERDSVSLCEGTDSIAVSTGDLSMSLAEGLLSVAASTGIYSVSIANHPTSIAVVWGHRGKAKGVIGSHLVLSDRRLDDKDEKMYCDAKIIRIDGKKYKEDTWYTLRNGKVVEWYKGIDNYLYTRT